MYSFENREDLENLNKLVSLQNQVKELRLQNKLGEQKFHKNTKKSFRTIYWCNKSTYRDISKTITETSIENNKAKENLNVKLLEILIDRGRLAPYLLSLLSKITNLDNTSQFQLVKDPNSKRFNDLLKHKTIPFTLYNNLLTFRDTGKKFEIKKRSFEIDN